MSSNSASKFTGRQYKFNVEDGTYRAEHLIHEHGAHRNTCRDFWSRSWRWVSSVCRNKSGFVCYDMLTHLIYFSMITMSAFIGKAPYHDFVSVMFLPLLPILALGLYWTNKVSRCNTLINCGYTCILTYIILCEELETSCLELNHFCTTPGLLTQDAI